MSVLAPVIVLKTAAYTAGYSELVLGDPTAGTFAVTLPSPRWGLAPIRVKNVGSSNSVSVQGGGALIDGASTLALPVGASVTVTTDSTATNWVITSSFGLITGTVGGDLSGTLPNPTVAKVNGVQISGTPVAGYVPTASDATHATWAAIAGTIGAPPSGPAGGDLGGSYPNPSVAAVNGVAVTGTPSVGYVPTATGPAAATWQSPGAALGLIDLPATFICSTSVTSATIGANQGQFHRNLAGGATISKIGMNVVTSSGNISVAVYGNTGANKAAAPGTRKGTSGAVACPAVGYAEVALGGSVAVAPGDWLALSIDNSTANISACGTSAVLSALWAPQSVYQTAAHPLPSTATPTGGIGGRVFLLIGVV